MNSLIKRFNLIFFMMTFFLSLSMFFVIYMPMKSELEKNLLGNFSQISYSKYNLVQSDIQNCVEGAMSLSSRTMINSTLTNFRNNEISLSELQAYTQPKYEQGAKVLKNIIQAERISNGHSIATYKAPNITTANLSWYTPSNLSDKVITQLNIDKETTIVMVISPILKQDMVLGYDYVAYDISSKIKALSTPDLKISLLDFDGYDHYVNDSLVINPENPLTLQHDDMVIYLDNLIPKTYFIATEKRSALFKTIKNLSIRILTIWVIILLSFTSLIYLYIIRYAKNELNRLKFSRDQFQTMAYRDDLTGAYSRTFLDIWHKKLRDSALQYSIVLIDIDNFKNINDLYGHVTGDSVLKKVVQVINDTIRQTDLLVRYGGDEFIILYPNDTPNETHSLMKRICAKLDALDEYDFVVHISYGISTLKNHDIFEESLELADQEMYQAKQAYKRNH